MLRLAAAFLVAATVGGLVILNQFRREPDQADVGALIRRHAEVVRESRLRPYVPPTARQRTRLGDGWALLEQGRHREAAGAFSDAGYELRTVELTGEKRAARRVVLVEGRDGLYLFAADGEAVVIEVPHPVADRRSEDFGIELFMATRARALLVAGTHREAGGRDGADAAHRTDTAFHAAHGAATAAARPAAGQRDPVEVLKVVQVHGFAAPSAPGLDIIVSSGQAPTDLTIRMWKALDHHYRTCLWTPETAGPCKELGGTRNAQRRTLDASVATFVHLEVAPELRLDRTKRNEVVDVIAATLRA